MVGAIMSVRLVRRAGSLEPLERRAVREDPGLYRVEGLVLPLPGLWTIRIEALITDFDKVALTAELPVE